MRIIVNFWASKDEFGDSYVRRTTIALLKSITIYHRASWLGGVASDLYSVVHSNNFGQATNSQPATSTFF